MYTVGKYTELFSKKKKKKNSSWSWEMSIFMDVYLHDEGWSVLWGFLGVLSVSMTPPLMASGVGHVGTQSGYSDLL